jgi:hypothetical protein
MGRISLRAAVPITVAGILGAVGGVLGSRRFTADCATPRSVETVSRTTSLMPTDIQTESVSPAALGPIAVEVWRLGRRIAQDAQPHPRVVDSHARLLRALEDAGARIDDPIHERFVEGTNAEIIDMPTGVDTLRDALIISDVVRPAIYVHERCVVTPQIMLERANVEEEARVAHDN